MLYTKAHLAVRHAASTDETRPNLNGIHFRADGSTEATDGHIMIRSKSDHLPEVDFPTIEGREIEDPEPTLESFILPSTTAATLVKRIPKKSSMPILTSAALDVAHANGNGAVQFHTTDLETAELTTARKIDGEFPDTDNVQPTSKIQVETAIDLSLVERFLKAIREADPMGGKNGRARGVKVEIRDEGLSAIRMVYNNRDGVELDCLIMPMRL